MRRDTLLARLGRPHDAHGIPVNTPVVRASTIVFPTTRAYEEAGRNKFTSLRYGRHGTDTTFALQDAVATLEGGFRAIALPSGLSAVAVVLSSFAKPGRHLLIADSVYGPARGFCEEELKPIGVEIEYYDPRIGGGIANLIRPETCAIYCESPGSATFEVQDIPAIAAAAHRRNVPVINDATWATPIHFPSFKHGVDVSIHAATKYIVGHSDAMLGLVVCNQATWEIVRGTVGRFGYAAAPDDCYLALRGLRTLGLRLERHAASALKIAAWLEQHPKVEQVLYPALPSSQDHALWKRDFSGASGLFSFVLKTRDRAVAEAFVDGLKLFGIGSSWGGFESLAILTNPTRTLGAPEHDGTLVRLHIGLEDPADLVEDLAAALSRVPRQK